MFAPVIAFPVIDPVLVEVGPFAIRWYALAYIFGLIGGWFYARRLVAQPAYWGAVSRPTVASLDDLLVYCAFGVILGGRLGYVLFYNVEHYMAEPQEIFALWKGGMSFHGGLAGAALAIWLFAQNETGWAIFMIAWGALAVYGMENFSRPILAGRASHLPGLLIFVGVLGGLVAWGLIGVFLGPVILAVAYELIQEWLRAEDDTAPR